MNPMLMFFLLLVGASFLIAIWHERSCTAETKGYVTNVISNRGDSSVEYTYRVNGQTYFGRAARFGGHVRYRSLAEAQTYLRGRTVTVHYNPARPGRSWADTSNL